MSSRTVSAATGDPIQLKAVCDVLEEEDGVSSRAGDEDSDNANLRGLQTDTNGTEIAPEGDCDDPNTAAKTDIESNENPIRRVAFSKVKSVKWEDGNFVTNFHNSGDSDDSDGSSILSAHSPTNANGKGRHAQMPHQGANYQTRKRIFISCAAGLLAFNNGFLNGATLSGLSIPGSKFSALTVTGMTASFTFAGLSLSEGKFELYGVHVGIILSYFLGCFIAGLITPNAKPYRLEPTYGPTFILGGIFLLAGGIIATSEPYYGVVAFWLSAVASGIQNGIASRYSANLIRCTVTGTTTDIALILAQILRGTNANIDNGIILSIITFNFWLGAVFSYFAAVRFLKYTLLANAVMFWIIGLGIIIFLVTELGLTVNAAVSGNWKWRKTMQSLRQASTNKDVSLVDMFDAISKNDDGEISPATLLDALLQAGVKTNLRTVRVLVNYADNNNNGTIDRNEWVTIVDHVMVGGVRPSSRSSIAARISNTATKLRKQRSLDDS